MLRGSSWLYDRRHDSMHRRVRRAVHVALRITTRVASARYRLRSCRVPDGGRLHLGAGRQPLPGWINIDISPFSGADLWLDLRGILRQCLRVLKRGVVVRIGVPSLESAVQQYLHHDFAFADWLDQAEPVAKRFIAHITDNGNHPIVLDFEYLQRLLTAAGFQGVRQSAGGQSELLPLDALGPKDRADDRHTLYVEGIKPGAADLS